MKNFTRILFSLALVMIALHGYSQSIGIKGGVNLGKILQEDADDLYSDDYSLHPGFHVGVVAEFTFTDMFALETGILLDTKGVDYEQEDPEVDATFDTSFNLYYITLPLYFKAEGDVNDNVSLYGKVGPYVSYGFSGEIESEFESGTETEDVTWGDDPAEDNLKPLDYGVSVGAGVEISSFLVELSYDVGWANISPNTDNDALLRTRVFRASVGYFFIQ